MKIIKKIKSKLIVSCQPIIKGTLDNPESIVALAQASVNGGASALRINGENNVYNVKKKLEVPVIGIIKRKLKIAFDTPNALWINSIREEVIAKIDIKKLASDVSELDIDDAVDVIEDLEELICDEDLLLLKGSSSSNVHKITKRLLSHLPVRKIA